jgi:hypothetical protein
MAVRSVVQLRPRMEKSNPKYKEQKAEVTIAQVADKVKQRLATVKSVSLESLQKQANELPNIEVGQNLQDYINQHSELAKIQPKSQNTIRLLQSLFETTRQIQNFKPATKKAAPPKWPALEPILGKKLVKAHKDLYDKIKAKVPVWANARPNPVKTHKTQIFNKVSKYLF